MNCHSCTLNLSLFGGTEETIASLGLGRPNYCTIHNDTPQVRGMINTVKYLVKVEEVKS